MKRLFLITSIITSFSIFSQVVDEDMQMKMLINSSIKIYNNIDFDSLSFETIKEINKFRIKNNLNQLQTDSILNIYAKNVSYNCMNFEIKHSDIQKNGIEAENIYYTHAVNSWIWALDGQLFKTIPEEIVTNWINSAGHKKNMSKVDVTKIGLGITTHFDGNDYKLIAIMVVD